MTFNVTSALNNVLVNVEASEREMDKQIEQGKAGIAQAQAQLAKLEEHKENTRALKMLLIAASTTPSIRESVEHLLGPASND